MMPTAELLPRCPALDGSSLRIVPAYTEAGMFCEANCVTVSDGEREAVYVPVGTPPPHTKAADAAVLDRVMQLAVPSCSPEQFDAIEGLVAYLREKVAARTYDL